MSETNRTTPAPESATPAMPHELCGAQHPDEAVTCALVKNPWEHQHVGHLPGDAPLEQRTVVWRDPTSCNRSWCVMDRTPEEHYDHHASDPVSLLGPAVGAETGYWGALLHRFQLGEAVQVIIAGRDALGDENDYWEVDMLGVETIVRILDDPSGGPALRALIAQFD